MPTRTIDADHAKKPRLGRAFWILGILIVVLLVGLVVVVLTFGRDNTPTGPDTTTPPAATTSPSSVAQPEIGAWVSDVLRGDDHVEEVAPGLWRCASSTQMVGDTAINGFEYGYPRTLQGAVAAAATYGQFVSSLDGVLPGRSEQFLAHLPITDPTAITSADRMATWATTYHSDPTTGAVLDPDTGTPDPTATNIAEAYPQYGMYKVLWTNTGINTPDTVDEVYVAWVFPAVRGQVSLGHENDGLDLLWISEQMLVVWDPTLNSGMGDWSLASLRWDPSIPQLDATNPGYTVLATMAGDTDWCVPADSTQSPLPGVWKTR